ncbi:MAG TPA: 2-oxo acid dehydrogenase subunit E2 [Mycobacteriales bacterium]|nr:2-oxo acid dehydrogenase subunit E2 [Mycobacteriales bacterium]
MAGSRARARRKIAIATWRPSRDGRLYGRLAIDASALTAHLERLRAESGRRITVTHAVGKAVALALHAVPEAHGRVVAGRFVAYPSCDIGFAVDIEGADLAPVKVLRTGEKSLLEIADEVIEGARRLRAGEDHGFATSSALARAVPWFLSRPLLSLAGLVNGGLGWRAFGQPGYPLGSAFVSNVGPFGLDEGLVAPVPFARVPIYVLVGRVNDAATVVDGAVEVRPQLVLTFPADHRIVDGAQAGRLVAVVKESLLDPARLDAV